MVKITIENGKVLVDGNVVEFRNDIDYNSVAFKFAGISTFKGDIAGLRAAGNKLGCSAAKFSKMLKAAMWKAYIVPNYQVIARLGYTTRFGFCPNMVKRVNDSIEEIKRYQEDGNDHLIGMAVLFGDTKTAKKALGSSLWKSIRRNSKSRNDLITRIASGHLYIDPLSSTEYFIDDGYRITIKDSIDVINKIPTTLLRNLQGSILDSIFDLASNHGINNVVENIVNYRKLPLNRLDNLMFNTDLHVIKDTIRMLNTLGERFDTKWSLKRIKKEHDDASKRIMMKKNSPDLLESMDMYPKELKYKGITATLLRSKYDVVARGRAHGHCVGSYAEAVASGSYVVYTLSDGVEENDSTLGISTTLNNNWQHYLKYNRNVIVDDFKDFAEIIRRKIKDIEPQTIVPRNTPDEHRIHQIVPHHAYVNIDEEGNEIPF